MHLKTNLKRFRIVLSALAIVSIISFAWKPYAQELKQEKVLTFSDLTFTDIGAATKKGLVATQNNEIKVTAGGADIWGTHDEFNFGYTTIKGDFDFSTQILSLSSANTYTKAGIMARTDLSDSSQHVYFQIFPDNSPRNKNNGGCEFQYRDEKAASMHAIYPDVKTAGDKFNVNFPNVWIRLIRHGVTFESFFSRDGKSWILYSTYSVRMPEELNVGLAVTSHNSSAFTTAQFASVLLK